MTARFNSEIIVKSKVGFISKALALVPMIKSAVNISKFEAILVTPLNGINGVF